jgi:hypothetical protein
LMNNFLEKKSLIRKASFWAIFWPHWAIFFHKTSGHIVLPSHDGDFLQNLDVGTMAIVAASESVRVPPGWMA